MHLLDSIVVFPAVGDLLVASAADDLMLAIDGPFGADLNAGDDNLVLQAARLLSDTGVELRLCKNLPVASGIGGGSADAAACIRLLADMWDVDLPSLEKLTNLGADVPVCVKQVPTRMSGIGEKLTPLPTMAKFWIVLVNAKQGVETGAVFGAMKSRNNVGLPNIPKNFTTLDNLFDFLRAQRNDMQKSAIAICPVIAEVLSAIEATRNCELNRMSGSGGTCFGLYKSEAAAIKAADKLREGHPNWWVVSAVV